MLRFLSIRFEEKLGSSPRDSRLSFFGRATSGLRDFVLPRKVDQLAEVPLWGILFHTSPCQLPVASCQWPVGPPFGGVHPNSVEKSPSSPLFNRVHPLPVGPFKKRSSNLRSPKVRKSLNYVLLITDGEGFEPPVSKSILQFSRLIPSTTQTSIPILYQGPKEKGMK